MLIYGSENNDLYNNNIGKEFSRYEILYHEFNIRNVIYHCNWYNFHFINFIFYEFHFHFFTNLRIKIKSLSFFYFFI